MSCLQGNGATADGLYGCVVSSCPGIATPLTTALLCQFSNGNGSCQSICDSDASKCQPCVDLACQAQNAAVVAAACT
jgi:hypothetical protein